MTTIQVTWAHMWEIADMVALYGVPRTRNLRFATHLGRRS
jgi:hypothetical protein